MSIKELGPFTASTWPETTPATVEALRAQLTPPGAKQATDYAIARAMNVSWITVRRWKEGNASFSYAKAALACELLGLPPGYGIAMVVREGNDEDQRVADAMDSMMQQFRAVATMARKGAASLTGAAILALLATHAEPVRASTYDGPSSGPVIHYAKLRRRRWGRRATDKPPFAGDHLQGFLTRITPRRRATA